MPYISLEHMRVYYQQTGSGPDLVLIHAVTSNLSVWKFSGIMDQLANDFRVTAYDLRGHGMSQKLPSNYTSKDMADDFKKLHQALNLERAFLVGHSFGGCVAMHTAYLYPEIVEAVVLSDTYFPGLKELEPHLSSANVWQKWCTILRNVGADVGNTLDFEKLFKVVASLTAEQKETLSQTLDPFAMRWLSQLEALADTTCGRDVFEKAGLGKKQIKSIQKPIFALYDEHSSFSATRNFFKQNGCIVEDVASANHLAPLENPQALIHLLKKYLICTS